MVIKRLLLFFAIIVLYKFSLNLYRLVKSQTLFQKYLNWLKNDEDTDLGFHKSEFVLLMTKANVKDSYFPLSQPIGYGFVSNSNVSTFHNFPSNIIEFVKFTVNMFQEAIGTYRRRMIETFNPFFWIETVIFLPKTLFSYLGVSPESLFIKILQVIWWIIAPIAIIARDYLLSIAIEFFRQG